MKFRASRAKRDKALELLEQGWTVRAVCRHLRAGQDSVRRWAHHAGMTLKLGPHGGLAPVAEPALDPGRHNLGHGNRLDLADRMAIQFGLEQGHSFAQIARRLAVAGTTVSREVARGRCPKAGRYIARRAQDRAIDNRPRPRAGRLQAQPRLRAEVMWALNHCFSPRQVSLHLARRFPGEDDMQVSHETIYQALYVQGRGALRHELKVAKALRSGRTKRRPVSDLPPRSGRPWLAGHHISTRPAEVEDRAVPGHWEGDLVLGAGRQSALITLVERASRFTMIRRLPDRRDSTTVVDALIEMARQSRFASLTWDQGSELAEHRRWSLATDAQVYFCDPHAPWQRGTNENTNGLIRDFYPKGTDFRAVTDAQITEVQYLLNIRPRQTLHGATPAEHLTQLINDALTT